MKKILLSIIIIFLIDSIACKKNIENKISKDITIVYIDDKTLNFFGTYPWTRDKYAKIIEVIYKKYKPSVVYFDIIIDMPSKETPQHDKKLFRSIKDKKNLVFCSAISEEKIKKKYYKNEIFPENLVINSVPFISNGGYFSLPDIIKSGGKISLSSIKPSDKGFYNSYPALFAVDGNYYLSTPIVLLELFKKNNRENMKFVNNYLIINKNKLSLNKIGFIDINFKNLFNSVSYIDVVKGMVNEKYINNKIILIGKNATGTTNVFPTKISLRLNGTELIAHATQTLLNWYKNENTTD